LFDIEQREYENRLNEFAGVPGSRVGHGTKKSGDTTANDKHGGHSGQGKN
jgi:hypothetical protein